MFEIPNSIELNLVHGNLTGFWFYSGNHLTCFKIIARAWLNNLTMEPTKV